MRFNNLRPLIEDMKEQNWKIEVFDFTYNEVNTIVLLTILDGSETIKNPYALKKREYLKASLKFFLADDINQHTKCNVDFYNCYFEDTKEFYDFFNIQGRGGNGNQVFNSFSEHLANSIPTEKTIHHNQITKRNIVIRSLGNDEDNIYCCDVRRSGGNRSQENRNKAEILRPELFELFRNDEGFSFYFSPNEEDEHTDAQIMQFIADRKH